MQASLSNYGREQEKQECGMEPRAPRAAKAYWGGSPLGQQTFSSATKRYTRYTYSIYDKDW